MTRKYDFPPAIVLPSLKDRQPASFIPSFHSLRRLFALLTLWQERSRQRRHLAQLDRHLLADIGKSREEADRESIKPFWR